MDYKTLTSCRICKSKELFKYLDLGFAPLSNNLLDHPSLKAEKYPVSMLFCQTCYLSQLSIVVDPSLLYSHYLYHSSVSETFKKHCYSLAIKLRDTFMPQKHTLIVDIASNDGCLLREFQKAGFSHFLGIEPASNLASEPYGYKDYLSDNNKPYAIPVLKAFWSLTIAKEYVYKANNAGFIIATNVLAHVHDLDDFLSGVEISLKKDGVFVAEFPYLWDLFTHNQFDTIYHEHLSYFLLAPLIGLFRAHNLSIFDVEELDIHGGSLRIYASKDFYPVKSSVNRFLDIEASRGLYSEDYYLSFGSRVDSVRTHLSHTLGELYNLGSKVMGYGASAKGISLLNYCHVDNTLIDSIVDDTPEKQNKWTPGSLIPIVDFSRFEKDSPDYILLLAWNFKEELIRKTQHLNCKYILPIPEVRVI